jgi:hypothetical protein
VLRNLCYNHSLMRSVVFKQGSFLSLFPTSTERNHLANGLSKEGLSVARGD